MSQDVTFLSELNQQIIQFADQILQTYKNTFENSKTHLEKNFNEQIKYFNELIDKFDYINKRLNNQITQITQKEVEDVSQIIIEQIIEEKFFQDLKELLILNHIVLNCNDVKQFVSDQKFIQKEIESLLSSKVKQSVNFYQPLESQTKLFKILQSLINKYGSGSCKIVEIIQLVEQINELDSYLKSQILECTQIIDFEKLKNINSLTNDLIYKVSFMFEQNINKFLIAKLIGQRFFEINFMSKFNKNDIIKENIRHRRFKTKLRFLNNFIDTEKANQISTKQDQQLVQKTQELLDDFTQKTQQIFVQTSSNAFMPNYNINAEYNNYGQYGKNFITHLHQDDHKKMIQVQMFKCEKSKQKIYDLQSQFTLQQNSYQEQQSIIENLKQKLEIKHKQKEEEYKTRKKILAGKFMFEIIAEFDKIMIQFKETLEQVLYLKPRINYYKQAQFKYVIDPVQVINNITKNDKIINQKCINQLKQFQQQNKKYISVTDLNKILSPIIEDQQKLQKEISVNVIQKNIEILKSIESFKIDNQEALKMIIYKDWLQKEETCNSNFDRQNALSEFNDQYEKYFEELKNDCRSFKITSDKCCYCCETSSFKCCNSCCLDCLCSWCFCQKNSIINDDMLSQDANDSDPNNIEIRKINDPLKFRKLIPGENLFLILAKKKNYECEINK